MVEIMSMNCRGLRDTFKRNDVINYFLDKQYSIWCLQDTHFNVKDISELNSITNFEHFHSTGTNYSRGVSIHLNKKLEYEIMDEDKDSEGNLLGLKIKLQNKIVISLLCIYGPNKDTPSFFKKISTILDKFNSEASIICGDWNLVQNFSHDCYNYVHQNNKNAVREVDTLKTNHNLIDPWRLYNPKRKGYTWTRNNPTKKARLDFFLISEEISSLINKPEIRPGYKTDHSLISLKLNLTTFKKGPGFWRFNDLLLKNIDYIKQVKDVINNTIIEYASLPYNQEQILNIPKDAIHFTINDHLFLEMLLHNIRRMTISYSIHWKHTKNLEKFLLEERIEYISMKISSNDIVCEEMQLELNESKNKLEKIIEEETKGMLLRAKLQWIEEGEKPSKYFLALEKKNNLNKIISRVVDSNNKEITSQYEILDEVKNFYQTLYSNKDENLKHIDPYINNLIPKLKNDVKNSLEQPISKCEILTVLKKMKEGKSPGSDGFTSSFFKVFWIDISAFILRSIEYTFEIGELSVTDRYGVISVIPKGNKPREFIKNWRPITLLSTTYKLLSGCIAGRIKNTLETLIHQNQKGFLSGRFIGENTRLIYDLIEYSELYDVPGLLILIDFEKAFDSVSWKFLYEILKIYNFGDNLRKWVRILNYDFKACVIQNGLSSPSFNINRGCKQGDPISPYLFLLCVEILGIMFRNNEKIKGIKIGHNEHKILQYADDTAITLDGSENSLRTSLDLLEQYAKFSGLKPNIEKTVCVRIGASRKNNHSLCPDKNLIWLNDSENFKCLGIIYNVNTCEIVALNFSEKMADIKSKITQWSKRNLSVLGRVTVTKSLLIPKLTILLQSLPSPHQSTINEIQTMFYNFIWNSKTERISRTQMCQDYKMGGCKMLDFAAYNKSLKLSWYNRILHNKDPNISNVFLEQIEESFKSLTCFGASFFRKIAKEISLTFWKEVFLYLSEYLTFFMKTKSIQEYLMQPIWYNDNIKIDESPIFIKKWYDKGIIFVNDLYTKDGNFIDYEQFCKNYNLNSPFTTFYGLKHAILKSKNNSNETLYKMSNPIALTYINQFLRYKENKKDVYEFFKTKQTSVLKWEEKWEKECSQTLPSNWWSTTYVTNVENIKEIRLRWFMIRFIHRILATNKYLNKIGVKTSEECTFCSKEPENIIHLYWECPKTSNFWKEVLKWLKIDANKDILYILFGTDPTFNIISILGKYHIYKQRLRNTCPAINLFITEVKSYYQNEIDIYCSEEVKESFRLKWSLVEKTS